MQDASRETDFAIRPLTPADAGELAVLHARCFEGYFLTNLGPTFLRRYYHEFCRHAFDYGVIARVAADGRLAAFVVGTSDTQAHFRAFYRGSMHVLAPVAAWRVVTNGVVRRAAWGKTAHLRAALMSLVPGHRRPASETISDKGPKEQCPVRLLGIAAAPEHRGSGVAQRVTAAFEQMLREAGHRRVGLSVLPDNARAIAFYRKTGWTETHASAAGTWFERDL